MNERNLHTQEDLYTIMYFDVAMVIILVKPAMLVCQQHHRLLALVYKNTRGSTIILSKQYPYLTSLSMETNIS